MGLEKSGEMSTKHCASVRLSLLLPGRVDSCHPLPACIPCALWSPAHRAARLLPGAILKLPIWGDPADENCFEDDVYWEVRRGAARPRFAVAAGSGAEGRRAQGGAVAPRRSGGSAAGAGGRGERRVPHAQPRQARLALSRPPPPDKGSASSGWGAAWLPPPQDPGPPSLGAKVRLLPVRMKRPALPFSTVFVMNCYQSNKNTFFFAELCSFV